MTSSVTYHSWSCLCYIHTDYRLNYSLIDLLYIYRRWRTKCDCVTDWTETDVLCIDYRVIRMLSSWHREKKKQQSVDTIMDDALCTCLTGGYRRIDSRVAGGGSHMERHYHPVTPVTATYIHVYSRAEMIKCCFIRTHFHPFPLIIFPFLPIPIPIFNSDSHSHGIPTGFPLGMGMGFTWTSLQYRALIHVA